MKTKRMLWPIGITVNEFSHAWIIYGFFHLWYFYIIYFQPKNALFHFVCHLFMFHHIVVCVYWLSRPLSWLLIKRLLYAEAQWRSLLWSSLHSFTLLFHRQEPPVPPPPGPLSFFSPASFLFSLQTVPPTSPDGNPRWNAKQQKGLFPVVIWRR